MTEAILITETGLNVPGSLVVQVSTDTKRDSIGRIQYPREMYFVERDEMNNTMKLTPITWATAEALAPDRFYRMRGFVDAAFGSIEQHQHDKAKAEAAKQQMGMLSGLVGGGGYVGRTP